MASWTGDTAEIWAERRHVLAESLDAVAGIYQTVAAVLREHARLLVWAQEQAAVAVALWAQGVRLGTTLDGQLGSRPLLIAPRPQLTGPFGIDQGLPETDPGAGTRRAAERVLFAARREVQVSNAAVAQVMDAFSEGLPDGQFHFDQFLAGIGDWFAGIAGLLYKFNQIRFIVDNDAFTADAHQMGEGLYGTGKYLLDNPLQAVPVLFDTRTMHDNPGRWWGRLFPDLALTVAGGVGVGTKLATSLRAGGKVADELADVGDHLGDLGRAGSRWDDPALREQWVEDLRNGPDAHPQATAADWADYQRQVAGDTEFTLRGGGRRVNADGVTLDPDTVVALEAKYTGNPLNSPYNGAASRFMLDRLLADFDGEIVRYGAVMDDAGNPVTRLRIVTSDPAAAPFLEARARAILGDGLDVVGEYRP